MKPLRDWDDLPDFMRTKEVRPYYDILKKHEKELYLKRAFDVFAASVLIVFLVNQGLDAVEKRKRLPWLWLFRG